MKTWKLVVVLGISIANLVGTIVLDRMAMKSFSEKKEEENNLKEAEKLLKGE